MDTLTRRTADRFAKAVTALENALKLGTLPEHAERDAALLRFELAAELMSKVLRRILIERGADISLPKDSVRAAHEANLIDDSAAETLLAVIDDRNRMVHDYSEGFAEGLFRRIKGEYAAVFRDLLHAIQKKK